jgi:hypothetical protein
MPTPLEEQLRKLVSRCVREIKDVEFSVPRRDPMTVTGVAGVSKRSALRGRAWASSGSGPGANSMFETDGGAVRNV